MFVIEPYKLLQNSEIYGSMQLINFFISSRKPLYRPFAIASGHPLKDELISNSVLFRILIS